MRKSLMLSSCLCLVSAWSARASAQEGGAPSNTQGANVSDAELQRRIDDAVARQLGQSQGSSTTSTSPASQGGDGSIGAQIEDMMNQKLPFELHSSAYLWYYDPMMSGTKSNTEIYWVNLTIDGKDGDFGYHVEPRFRDTKLRPFFQSNIWIQEAYGSWKAPNDVGTLKAGKEYSRFGHFWDDSFFGNQPYFDGLKLDPDIGLSLENSRKVDEKVSVEYALQFFPNDGRTNGSLQNRDTISYAGASRRNMTVVRVAPKYNFTKDVALTVGGSGEQFRADFATPTQDDTVYRAAFDSELAIDKFTVFGEVTQQWGRSVTSYPDPGSPSDDVVYYWSGVKYQWESLVFRFAYSTVNYKDNSVRETTYLPGITWTVNDHMALLVEYDAWRRTQPGSDLSLDRSLNLILYFHF